MTTTTTKTTRQTAGNNAALARVKRRMNGPIFKRVMDALNAEGAAEARAVLARYFRDDDAGRAAVARIFDGAEEDAR